MIIELFPAGNGDALLVSGSNYAVLVDAGYTSTFRDHLKPRLQQLQRAGKRLDQLIVTHVDADHISGAIAMLKANGASIPRKIIEITDVWFNSYRHLPMEDKEPGEVLPVQPDLGSLGGHESREADVEDVYVSHRQGTTLGSLLLKNNYHWNRHFNGKAVEQGSLDRTEISPNTYLSLLGPTADALKELADKWYDFLRKKYPGKINENTFFDDAFELMMEEEREAALEQVVLPSQESLVSGSGDWVDAFATDFEIEDNSETNGSSITFLLEEGDKKALFLGDAIPSQVMDQLRKMQGQSKPKPIKVNVLKVAHHGAWSNNHPDLFDLVHADYYLFSSNGKRHHHPHLQTIAWILKKNPAQKTLVFNYRQANRLSILENENLQKKYQYKLRWPDVDEFGQGTDGYVKVEV